MTAAASKKRRGQIINPISLIFKIALLSDFAGRLEMLIVNTSGSGFDKTDLLNVDPMLGRCKIDQRGGSFRRIVNEIIDIGAYEVQADQSARRVASRRSLFKER